MIRAFRQIAYARGRWIGRKDAVVAGARGIPSLEARRILAGRAADLHGPMLDGFWRGVAEMRPEWEVLTPTHSDSA